MTDAVALVNYSRKTHKTGLAVMMAGIVRSRGFQRVIPAFFVPGAPPRLFHQFGDESKLDLTACCCAVISGCCS